MKVEVQGVHITRTCFPDVYTGDDEICNMKKEKYCNRYFEEK